MKDLNQETSNDEYYKILGLEKDCTPQEIKKQYYKMALKWHPDKQNPNSNNKVHFTKVQEAYSTLSNERKKKVYDKYGKEGLELQENCTRISQKNTLNDFFKNDYFGTNLSGFDVLKNILQDKNEASFSSPSFNSLSQSRLKSFLDDNFLSTDSEDENNDFCSSYKPTFLNTDFMKSTGDLEQSIFETEKKYHIKKETPQEQKNSPSFTFFMNALKKGYSKASEESDEEVFIETGLFSKRINPNESMINANYYYGDEGDEENLKRKHEFLNSNSKRIKKENITRVK